MGLLAAFSYEVAILRSASRLTAADAFRQLHALYRERTHPLSPPPLQQLSSGAGAAGGSGAAAGGAGGAGVALCLPVLLRLVSCGKAGWSLPVLDG